MQIRVAAAADTILYLPLYCIQHVHRPQGIEILLEAQPNGAQLGDEGAYSKVQRGEADLCVCDPMVVLQEYRRHGATIGAVVSSLVTSTGLWALRTPSLVLAWDRDKSLLDLLDDNPGTFLSSILTYDTASTAGRVVQFMINSKMITVSPGVTRFQRHCKFGEELQYLTMPLEGEIGSSIPELVITCDLVGALVADRRSDRLAPDGHSIGIAINFPSLPKFKSALFTGLIVHRGFLLNNQDAVIKIVTAIQEVLESFYKNPRLRWSMAEMIADRNQFFPSLKYLNCNDTDRKRFCHEAIDILQKDHVIAQSVKLNKAEWERQAELWGGGEIDHLNIKDKAAFYQCCDTTVGARAHPHWLLLHARRLRRFVLPIMLPIVLLFEVFHGLAAFYHLYHLEPDNLFWISLASIVLGVLVAFWLFGLREAGRHG